MASATTMYHTDKNPLHQVTYKSETCAERSRSKVHTAKSPEQRKLHKAFLRWHDPKNWPLLRKAMAEMGRQELIGDGDNQLIPHYKVGEENLVYESHRRKNKGGEHQKRTGKTAAPASKPQGGKILTQHTGLPPKAQVNIRAKPKQRSK